MSESDLRGTWKVKAKKEEIKNDPILGMVYIGINKFNGNKEVGILVELHNENDEAVLQTKQKNLVSVDKNFLEIVVSY
jgi:hypothetical protein